MDYCPVAPGVLPDARFVQRALGNAVANNFLGDFLRVVVGNRRAHVWADDEISGSVPGYGRGVGSLCRLWHSDAAHLCGSLGGSSTRNHFGQSDHDGGICLPTGNCCRRHCGHPKRENDVAGAKDGGH